MPPQSLEAEESILGALMLMPYDSPILDEIAETGLQAGDFYRESHATIYKAALELQAERIEPNAVALTDRLEQQGRLEQVGGRPRIHELAALVPATRNAPHYARIVHETACLRGLIRVGQETTRIGFEGPGDTRQRLGQASLLFDELIASSNGAGPSTAIELVTLEQFTGVTDDQAEPLIGTPDEALLPVDGLLLMYGDGGAGKTTLSIDALAHIASGTEWLGNPIPASARCTIIENEGPRGPFRRRLRDKMSKWTGKSFSDNVLVLEEPWTQFTLADAHYRRGLAKEIERTKTQLVIVGPLASIGAKGTGTPDDVNEFAALIADLRTRSSWPFALWIVHHENKAGDVSGAWERLPDTLVHVTAQGNGRTRAYWRKVRHDLKGAIHNTSVNLLWADNTGFTIELPAEIDLGQRLVDYLEEHPRASTNDIVTDVKGGRNQLRRLLEEDPRFNYEKGPNRSKLWNLSGSNLLTEGEWDKTEKSHKVPPVPPGSTGGGTAGSLPVGETRQIPPGPEWDKTDEPPSPDAWVIEEDE